MGNAEKEYLCENRALQQFSQNLLVCFAYIFERGWVRTRPPQGFKMLVRPNKYANIMNNNEYFRRRVLFYMVRRGADAHSILTNGLRLRKIHKS